MSNKNSPWSRSSGYKRKINTREPRKRVLIVCEGAKTEPNYFNGFRVNRLICEIDIRGTGYNTASLVRKAISLKQQEEFDEVWCVFDRDSFSAQEFNSAFGLAQRNNIKIAYSNEAFELWYLLHFNYYDAAISRGTYGKRLTKLLGHKYEKNSDTIYEELIARQPVAIKNAQQLYSSYQNCNPERDNPSTTVHLLVIALNDLNKNQR